MNKSIDTKQKFNIVCSWCGKIIRTGASDRSPEVSERMCLICHARMLDDYFRTQRAAQGGQSDTKEPRPS